MGRSERQAYAYLIAPDMDALSDDARKRLEALYEFTELGSGFRIAHYDMEIRGAGNLLGTSQSGQIRAVGYDLYMDFLEKAIRELKGEEVVEEVDPEIHFEMPALLPNSYIEDSTQRLSLYKRLATAKGRALPIPEFISGNSENALQQVERRLSVLDAKAEQLRERIYEALSIARVYTKIPGKKPDMDKPYVVSRGTTIIEFAATVHKDFGDNLKFARVWGHARFDGQPVEKEYVLEDGDVVELHI